MSDMVEPASPAGRVQPSVGVLDLFVAFSTVGIVGFGGVMPWVRWMLVEKRGWLTDEEFINVLSLSQLLPGGNVMNIAVAVGNRFAGFTGAAVALVGLMLLPSLLVLAIGLVYATYGNLPWVQGAFRSVAAAAAGLIIAMGLRFAYPMRRNPRAMLFMGATLVASAAFSLPLLWTIALFLPTSILAAWIFRK